MYLRAQIVGRHGALNVGVLKRASDDRGDRLMALMASMNRRGGRGRSDIGLRI